jgi:uncharacterized protein (DUF1810 family)
MNGDPYNLTRFLEAQAGGAYEQALAELRSGHKRSHWMWFIFPQIAGLGVSARAQRYAIGSLDEVRAYLAHPVLGPRIIECAEALLALEGRHTAVEILGYPDDLKLCSSATLFRQASPAGSVFQRLLERYFGGRPDERTLALLAVAASTGVGDSV